MPLETKETHLPAPVAHPHPRSRQPLSPEQEQEQEELHHPTRPLPPLSPVAAAAPRANIISNKGRYQEQQEQGQRQGQRRLLSPADIPGLSLSLAFGRQTAPFLFGLGPLSLSFLFPFQLVVVVSPPSTTTTDKDHPTSLLGHYCCPTDLFFVPFNSTCCCHHCSSTYTTCRSRGSLPFLLQRALLSHLQSWSLQSLFVAYSLPLLVCLTPGLVLPLSIFQILSLIASSSSSSPSSPTSPISSDQPHSSSLPLEKTSSIATNNSNLIKNATSSTISKPSPPSFLFSFFSSSPPSSTPTSTHRRHFRSNYSLTHNQTTAPTTTTTTRQTPMSSSSSSSSSSNVTGGSSSSFRIDFPPPLPLPPPRQAPWSPTSFSSGSSSSASSSSSTSTITVATRTQAQASSHRPHFNQHAFAPPPPLTQTHTQTQQQQQLQFRQPLPRHSNNTESTIDYDSEQQYHEQHHNHNHEHEHDHEYDHGSDDESEGDAMSNELEYYLQRCSICFDSRLDFCLEMCRDQFCRDCFQKYVKEVVSNSWGLDVTKIKCPVCQDPLPLAEWSKYVDQATLAQYQQYNQPYRSFSRFCNGCDNEVAISRVKQSILGLPSRDLLPLFETLLVQLKSLLLLGGLNPEASSKTSSASTMFSSMDRHKRHKHSGTGLLKRDVRAQELVQQFIKDYRSFCGPPQGNGTTIPSMAHSYFSSLAMRALGGGSAPPVPAPPPANTGQHSNVQVIQSGVHGAPGGGQSVGFQQHLDARSAHPLQDSAYRSVPSSLFQRKQQQPVTATGVLEMYKDLMVTLIELFDLKFPEQHDSVEVAPQADAMDESEAYAHLGTPTAVTRMSASGKVATDTDLCGGVTIETVRIPKRTVTDRSKIVTRAETRRQLEVKKALVRFSKELLSLEVRPEQWKELQFLHVRWCRWDWCNTCDLELCLQCGVSSHHESKTCFEHMRSVITTNTPTSRRSRASKVESCSPLNLMGYKGKERSDLDTGTMQWKLANTNPCPNCCILIHRDDGCNKVDCMLCGHRFCWVCREAWDVGCGFFRCRLAAEEPAGEEPDDHWEKHPDEWKDNDVQAAEQVETLTIAMGGEPPHAGQGRTDTLTMRHDRRRRRSDDLSAAISEKPEIGVPNVFMIQAKRSRA